MNWFKRLCLFLFGLCGLASLAALALTWVGPWTPQFRSYLEIPMYFYVLEGAVCVAAVGLLICVLYALFKPRNPKETIIATLPGGQISVMRSAIVSQTRHVVEADGSCIASSVKVRMRKRGNVRIRVIVTPRWPINVAERSVSLHEELEQGLTQICGDEVKSIVLAFKEPQQLEGPYESGEVESYVSEDGQEVRIIASSGTKVISGKRAAEITIAPVELAAMLGKGEKPASDTPQEVAEDATPVASEPEAPAQDATVQELPVQDAEPVFSADDTATLEPVEEG